MAIKRNRDDSSSSEDEELQKALKEATDYALFENTNLSATKSETPGEVDGHKKNKSPAKSLRRSAEEEKNEFSNFGVTPTFQNFVAKKLNEILEKSVEVNNEVLEDIASKKESDNNDSGIKLLSSSAKYVTAEEEAEKPQKRRIEATLNDEENYLKCKEVAVDPEWILSRVETKAWTSKRKEPEFKYKRLESGVLIEKS